MPRKSLFLMVLFFVFLSSCSNSNKKKTSSEQTRIATIHQAKPSYPKDAIPFSIVDNRMILKMFINDSIPVNVLFDSGFDWGDPGNQGRLTLSSFFVKNHLGKVNIPKNDRKLTFGTERGGIVKFKYSDTPINLYRGRFKEKITNPGIYDSRVYMSDPNHDGIINIMGLKALKENILEINFERRYLRIIFRSDFSIPSGYKKIGIRLVSNPLILFPDLPFYLLGCNGDTINLSGDYAFDTGNPSSLVLSERKKKFRNFERYLRENCTASKTEFYSYLYGKTFLNSFYKIKGYSLGWDGKFTHNQFLIHGGNLFPSSKNLWDGILPLGIIKNFNYYFDLKNKVVYFKGIPVKKHDAELPIWGFHINHSKYTVEFEKKNSVIDKAGILCGDTVLSINNYPLSHYNRDSLRHLKLGRNILLIKYKTKRKQDTLRKMIHLN